MCLFFGGGKRERREEGNGGERERERGRRERGLHTHPPGPLPVAAQALLVVLHQLVGGVEGQWPFLTVLAGRGGRFALQRRVRVRVVGAAERCVAHVVKRAVGDVEGADELLWESRSAAMLGLSFPCSLSPLFL